MPIDREMGFNLGKGMTSVKKFEAQFEPWKASRAEETVQALLQSNLGPNPL